MILVAEKATGIFYGIIPSPNENKSCSKCTHDVLADTLTTFTYAHMTSELFSPPELTTVPEFMWLASVQQMEWSPSFGKDQTFPIIPQYCFCLYVHSPHCVTSWSNFHSNRCWKYYQGALISALLKATIPLSCAKTTRGGDFTVPSTPPAAKASTYLHNDPTDLEQNE